jgi:Secretory lipase
VRNASRPIQILVESTSADPYDRSVSRHARSRSAIRLAAAAVAAVGLAAAVPGVTHAAVPLGPLTDDFYTPPAELLDGPQGSVVWARPSSAITTPAGAARATTVIYRSRSIDGRPSFVSGDVLLPKGAPPQGGWPVVAWDHVTTGGADRCAPTRATPQETDSGRMVRGRTVATGLLKRGVAVVRTDYEGLGTPGRHPYLMGRSLAQATVDMVRAGRDLDPTLSRQWVAAGQSEGGVAALFTGALAGELAPELELRGVSSVSPVMSMLPLFEAGRNLPVRIGEVTALASLVLDGAGTEDPVLDASYRQGGLSARALAVYPQIQERCYGNLTRRDSWGGLTPAQVLGPQGNAAYARFRAVLERNDTTKLRFPATLPLRIDQGDLDPVTWRPLADAFVRRQRQAGVSVAYRTYPFGTHANITDAGFSAEPVAAWAAARLR